MSYRTGRETLSSSGAYHESLPLDDSGNASFSSELNLYNSELASSSQACDKNTVYHDGNQYSLPHDYNHGDQQQQQLQQEDGQNHTPLMVPSLPRSNPIAIIRAPGKREVDESDFDDDDSDIDVEGDAIKLRRKYGNKIIQTYIQESTIVQSSNAQRRDKSSVLNAPYLGSLSKSSNQVLSLPPISLAGDSDFLGEPPESIVSYGSLRDSHERGRFLDGPSSYREPMSGKIRQLDHRLRYHGRQPELNIGERMQQSRRLKELRLKRENEKKKESTNGEPNTENANEGDEEGKKAATSSLSAMMRDASKNVNAGGAAVDDFREGDSFLSTERQIPIQGENTTPSQNRDHHSSMHLSPRTMLSTSLTAFELLKSSNTDTLYSSSVANPPYSSTHTTETNQTLNFRNSSGFQPLSRSMSDPSPRFENLSISEIPAGSVLPSIQTGGLAAQMENALPGIGNARNQLRTEEGKQNTDIYRFAASNAQFARNESATAGSIALTPDQTVMFHGGGLRSPHSDHDPNTDGAFGDMDM